MVVSDDDVARWNRRVVAVANNKGGVKKTSVVVNVAGQLAAAGLKVLIVALDTQHENAATDLGYLQRSDHGESLAAALIDGTDTVVVVDDVRPRLDVVADGPALESVVRDHYGKVGRGERSDDDACSLLRPALATHAPRYDLVLLDCPPGHRVLVDAALGSARWVLIPTATDLGSIRSMEGTARAFMAARTRNPTLALLGVLLTGSGTTATTAREHARTDIDAIFGGHAPLFDSFVRHAESPATAARSRGLLAHELERVELDTKTSQPWYTMLRRGGRPGDSRRVWTTNSAGLSEDYQRVTRELTDRLAAAEAADGSRTTTPTQEPAAAAAGEEHPR